MAQPDRPRLGQQGAGAIGRPILGGGPWLEGQGGWLALSSLQTCTITPALAGERMEAS